MSAHNAIAPKINTLGIAATVTASAQLVLPQTFQPVAETKMLQKVNRLNEVASFFHGLSIGNWSSNGSTLVSIRDSRLVCGVIMKTPTNATIVPSNIGMLPQQARLRPCLKPMVDPLILPASK